MPRAKAKAAGDGEKAGKAKGADAPPNEIQASIVARIIKDGLPKGGMVARDAKIAISRSTKIFILYVTSCANYLCHEAKRQTILPADVMAAMQEIGATQADIDALQLYLREMKDAPKKATKKRKRTPIKAAAEEEQEEEEEDADAGGDADDESVKSGSGSDAGDEGEGDAKDNDDDDDSDDSDDNDNKSESTSTSTSTPAAVGDTGSGGDGDGDEGQAAASGADGGGAAMQVDA